MLKTPLKMKWGKKSGRYELRQDVFVLSVFVGETPLAQCTLTSESTARDCMNYLRERIDLNQVEFFGLRFAMRFGDPDRRQLRWVDMDRPLRKQLEKWACKPRQLQLAILYHTPNVFVLHDQMTRSLYFMLLKLDVLSGRFPSLDADRYVCLAAYGLQVEQSDYDPAVHTIDHLRQLNLLPEHLCRQAAVYDELLGRVVALYEALAGMQSAHAAFQYIVDVQQCDGYGEEHFPAKDDESTDVKLGYSLEEIFVRRYNGSTLKFKWADVRSITSAKRNLILKCQNGPPVVFTMEDGDMARYVVDVLNWQWTYATTDAIQQKSAPMSIENLQCGFRHIGQPGSASTAAPAGGGSHSRHSNADVHSTRTTNSADLSARRLPAGPGAVNRSSSLLETNRVAGGSASFLSANQPSSSGTTVHSLQPAAYPSILNEVCSMNPNGAGAGSSQLYMASSNSTPSLVAHRVSQHSCDPNGSAAGASSSANASPVYRPAGALCARRSAEGDAPATSSSGRGGEDWLRAEQRAILKKLLAQREKIKTIGSSPEIHMLGVSVPAGHATRTRLNPVVRRVHNTPHARPPTPAMAVGRRRLSDEKAADAEEDEQDRREPTPPAAAQPQICPKWCSTPNLLTGTPAPPSITLGAGYGIMMPTQGHRYVKAGSGANRGATGSAQVPPAADLRIITDPSPVDLGGAPPSLLARADLTPGPVGSGTGSGLFSRGHIVVAGAVGQPIVYPVPTAGAAPASGYDMPNADRRLPPVYSVGYATCDYGGSSRTVSNASSASSCPYYGPAGPVRPSLTSAAVMVAGGSASSGSSYASSTARGSAKCSDNRGPSGLSATPSDASVASTSSTSDTANQSEEPSTMATRQRIYRQQNSAATRNNNNSVEENSKQRLSYHNNNSSNYNFNTAQQQQQQGQQQGDARHRSNSAGRNAATALAPKRLLCSETTNVMLAKLAIPQAVETEFAGVPAKRLSAGHSTSQCPDNQARNRPGKVFPYEDTRVVLRASRRNPDGYINASHVQMQISDSGRRLRYIVAQAPMRNTVDDFWTAVWETGARLIVMLVNPHQIHKATACPAYWPMKPGEKLQFGGTPPAFRVKLLSSASSNCQTTSVLSLKSLAKPDTARRTVYHLFCADFSEEGVPSSTDAFLGFIDAVNSVRKHIENEDCELRALSQYHQGKLQRRLAAANGKSAKSVTPGPAPGLEAARSRSIGRINLLDVTNRLRAQSVESGNLLRKKFSVTSSRNPSLSSDGSVDVSAGGVNGNEKTAAKDRSATGGDAPLTLVHCMDGASESGVFLLVESILRSIENNTEVDVAQLLRTLRQQRMCLVRTPGQYRFVYELVVAYLQRSRLI